MVRSARKILPVVAFLFAISLIAGACGDDEGEGILVGELAYYTGEFGAYGASLTNDVRFPIEEVINLDPPLGQEWTLISEDIGTVGEAQAARKAGRFSSRITSDSQSDASRGS